MDQFNQNYLQIETQNLGCDGLNIGLFPLSGETGVISEGLTNPWIPDGWQWGGSISDHAPLWTELYVSDPEKNEDQQQPKINNGFDMLKMAVPISGAGDM